MDIERGKNHRLRILVVEDMMLVAFDIKAQLDDLGCEVVGPVPRLAAALRMAAAEAHLDGAFLDINIAGEPCFPLAEALRARNVPVVFLTGHSGSYIPNDFQQLPRIQKPFDPKDLMRAVRDHFKKPDGSAALSSTL